MIVTEATSGKEALSILESPDTSHPSSFDCVLLDFQMPEIDGGELARRIRSISSLDSIVLILLTSLGFKDLVEESPRLFDRWMSKPVRHKELYELLLDLFVSHNNDAQGCEELSTDETHFDFSNLRILVAEDNRVNQIVADALLKKLGIACDFADDGDQAIKRLEEKSYDLVLMDIQMPKVDGLEATRKIRQGEHQTKRSHIPIIALSAQATKEDFQECLDAGMDDWLSKPVKIEILKEKILLWTSHYPKRQKC
jgi:CheY-like chemotaxis protein